MPEKNSEWACITSISVNILILINLFYFKIPEGYKNMTNCLIKIRPTFIRPFCGIFEGA